MGHAALPSGRERFSINMRLPRLLPSDSLIFSLLFSDFTGWVPWDLVMRAEIPAEMAGTPGSEAHGSHLARSRRLSKINKVIRYFRFSDRALQNLAYVTISHLSSVTSADIPLGKNFLQGFGAAGRKYHDLLWRAGLRSIWLESKDPSSRKWAVYNFLKSMSPVIQNVIISCRCILSPLSHVDLHKKTTAFVTELILRAIDTGDLSEARQAIDMYVGDKCLVRSCLLLPDHRIPGTAVSLPLTKIPLYTTLVGSLRLLNTRIRKDVRLRKIRMRLLP